MPNLASVLKEEIRRLARSESRVQTAATKKAGAQHRRDIAGLKRLVSTLARRVKFLEGQERRRISRQAPTTPDKNARYSAGWVKAHRVKVALSAADYGKLVGVSPLTVYHWEHGKSKPRRLQLAKWLAIRKLGKREAAKRLEMLGR